MAGRSFGSYLAAALAGVTAGTVAGVVVALAGPAAPAGAHATLLASTPASGAVLPTTPAEVVLAFSEPVRPVSGGVTVLAPDGTQASARPRVRGDTVVVPLRAGRATGSYLVSFRVVSADNHPVGGSVVFSVGTPSAVTGVAGDGRAGDGGADPVVDTLMATARGFGFAGLVLLVGPALVLAWLWPRRLSRAGPVRLAGAGLVTVGLATTAELFLQAPYGAGTGLTGATLADLDDVLTTRFGVLHLVRLAALAAIAVVAHRLLTGRAGIADRVVGLLAGATALATWPMAGHPGASTVAGLAVVLDAAHLSAVTVWLGGLVVLAGFLLRQATDRELGVILPVWSRWAAAAVVVVVATGAVQTLLQQDRLGDLVATGHGRLVLAKVSLLAVILTVAGHSRHLVRTRLTAQDPATGRPAAHDPTAGRRRLRASVAAELAIAALVLAAAAVLVQTSPQRATATPPPAPSGLVVADVAGRMVRLQVELTPGAAGRNQLHLSANTPQGTPLPVVEWRVTAALPARRIEPVPVALRPFGGSHAVAEIDLPVPGDWRLSYALRLSDTDAEILTHTVALR